MNPTATLKRLEKRFDLERYLEPLEPKKVGANWAVPCPQCGDEKDYKLHILMDDKVTPDGVQPKGSFVCYYCRDMEGEGTGRGVLALIEFMEDLNFYQAVQRLAEGGGAKEASFVESVEAAFAQFEPEDEEDDSGPPEVELPESFTPIDWHNAPPYLAERGISVARAMRFKLGFCPRGFYKKHLIVPAYLNGKLVSFQARYMRKNPPWCKKTKLPCAHCGAKKGQEHGRIKKTRFPKAAKTGMTLFNYDEARNASRIILVEDPFSAIKLGKTAVCTFGTHVSRHQMQLLLRSNAKSIVVLWDEDAIDKATKLARVLTEFYTVRVVELPDERDPDEHKLSTLRKLIDEAPLLDSNGAFAAYVKQRLKQL